MTELTLAAIYDPRGVLPVEEARRRVGVALEVEVDGDVEVVGAGALTVGVGGGRPRAPSGSGTAGRPLMVTDGDVTVDPRESLAACLASLRSARGPFVLVAGDRERCLLARDHLGIRPLFFRRDGTLVYAASEVINLLALLPRRPEPDLDALAMFLARRPDPRGATLYTGVRAVPPGHALVLERGGVRLERYWRPQPRAGIGHVNADEAAALLRDALMAAVERHGATAPGSGVLLSGGLDSSTVLACAASRERDRGGPPPAISGVFPGRPELDEQTASRAVAERWNAEWTPVPVTGGPVVPDALAYLERWELPLEHPTVVFFRPVREAAARRGVRVLLDGEGGDELFGCEPLLLADHLLHADPVRALRLARALPGTGGDLDVRKVRAIVRQAVLPGLLPPRVMDGLRRLRGHRAGGPAWLDDRARAAVLAGDRAALGWWRAGRPRWRAHLSWVLSDGRAAMAVHDHMRRTAHPLGLTDAHPLLDVELAETVLGLPPELSFDPIRNRPLLRRAMAGLLPEAVRLRRDKVYFNPLLLEAMTGPDRAAIDSTLGQGRLELGVLADAGLVRSLWRDGPARHPHGRWVWSQEMWRAFAAETWLRREAGNRA